MRAGIAVAAALTALGLVTSGCEGATPTKPRQAPVVLNFATVDEEIDNNGQMQPLQDFVDRVWILSAHQLQIKMTLDVGSGDPGSERDLVKAIAVGQFDGGWNATRAFAGAGVPAFEAVEAPFVLQSYPAEQELVTSPLAGQMMARLKGTGLVGLGLVAGPLRRPFAVARPLAAPGSWRGVSIRIEDSPVQRAAAVALGARPVLAGAGGLDQLIGGRQVGGQVFDLFQYAINGLGNAEPYVTANLTLWPKLYALVMNSKKFASLDPQQQGWLRASAQRAVQESATAAFDESAASVQMCLAGVRFTDATVADLAELRATVAPVYAQLRADEAMAGDLAALQAIDARHPTASEPKVPSGCRGTPPASDKVDTALKTRPDLPDGSYRVALSGADLLQYGATPGLASDNSGPATLTVHNGRFSLRFTSASGTAGASETTQVGALKGTATTMVFIPGCPTQSNCGPSPYSVSYEYSGGRLTMTVGSGTTDPVVLGVLASVPWIRVG